MFRTSASHTQNSANRDVAAKLSLPTLAYTMLSLADCRCIHIPYARMLPIVCAVCLSGLKMYNDEASTKLIWYSLLPTDYCADEWI